jgi:CheY-like chemotaxis protein
MNEQQAPDSTLLNGVNILLVEDSDMSRLVASTMLHNHGAIVHEAVNGLQAVEAMDNIPCDLVLMDIQMPVMDGRKAARMMRKSHHTNVPILALSANAVKKETDKCLAAGMNDCIAKPFEEEDLMRLIAKWLNKEPPPARAGGSEKPLYSLEKLEHTGRGDPDFVRKMIQLFTVQVPAGVQEIKTAYAAGSFAAVAATAHRMEPILNNFCIADLNEKMGELQFFALKRKASPRLESLIKHLDGVTAKIVDELIRKIGVVVLVLSSLLACSRSQAQTADRRVSNLEVSSLVPNGQGDCSTWLQHTLDSAAISGTTVFLQAGTYRLARTIRLPAGVSLVGSGMGANAIKPPNNGTILCYTGDSAAIVMPGTNSEIKDLTLYDPKGTASAGILILGDSQMVESMQLSRVLIYGFTKGTALLLHALHHGGIGYGSFYDCRIRNARIGIEILQTGAGAFVNSNSFFHGAISGGGFDNCILVNGGDNNIFYGTVIEPYTSVHGHLLVNSGQIIGENIRIEAGRQPANRPVIEFGPASAFSTLTGFYAGGVVINRGNNAILLTSPDFAGQNNPGYNQLVNAAFQLAGGNGLPAYWMVSNPKVTVSIVPDEFIPGESVVSIRVPAGVNCDFYPVPGYAPVLGDAPWYAHANFNIMAKAAVSGVVKLTYNYAGGLVSSAAHTGSGTWEMVGLQAITSRQLAPNPKINLNNSGGTAPLLVELTSPSFSFGMTPPQRDPAVITAAGGIVTGTLTTSVSSNYNFTAGTGDLVLGRNGNVFILSGARLAITRINSSRASRFPPGTIITLLFDNAGCSVQDSPYIKLRSGFTTGSANSSLSLLSNGDGTWRETNRNN